MLISHSKSIIKAVIANVSYWPNPVGQAGIAGWQVEIQR
jgi:hypothetical protein